MFFNNSKKELEEKNLALAEALEKIATLEKEYKEIIDKDKEIKLKQEALNALIQGIDQLTKEKSSLELVNQNMTKEIGLYEDQLEINAFGLYKPSFSFETSEQFKAEIEKIYEMQKQAIKDDTAVICEVQWTLDGNATAGNKMMNQYKKLMLFGFNGECDALIAKVKWNNAEKSKERIQKTYDNINKLVKAQHINISDEFLQLKIKELTLTHEYELKKYEEKEEQRVLREQMKEEEKAQKEFEKAQREAEIEEERFHRALEKAREELKKSTGETPEILLEQIKQLEQKLNEAHERKERAIAMAQLTKVGHIYIISNIGSFGENIYKIGMTRRLDPIDRIRELSDASVPFHFDIHAIIYSENAPQLETELHRYFSQRRLNQINTKKEFFNIHLDEIESFVISHTKAKIEFTKIAEAKEFRETKALMSIPISN